MNNPKKYLTLGRSPESDWKIIFMAAIILAVLVSVLNVHMFIKVSRGEFSDVFEAGESESETLDREVLRSTVSRYRGKEAAFRRIINSESVPVVDPSI